MFFLQVWFDIFCIGISLFDNVIMASAESDISSLMALRLLRFLRLSRVVRVFHLSARAFAVRYLRTSCSRKKY